MADTKISNLDAAASLSDAHEIPVREGGTNKKVTGAQIKNHTHTKSQISDFTHTHVQADITDFSHTHSASAITDFGEAVDDRIATTVVAGTNLTGTYNDAANTLTLDVDSHTHTASQVTDLGEAVDDRVAGLLTAGDNITLTYNDGAGTLEIDAAALGAHSHASTDISDFSEAVDDRVNGLVLAGAGITKTYNDAANTLTLAADLSAVSGFYNVGSDPYNAVLDGSVDDRAAFAAADLDADTNNGTVLVPRGTAKINSNLTLAARVHFAGGVIKPASGVTVTFNSRIVGDGQLFDRSLGGRIALLGEAAHNVKAEWFGSTNEVPLHSLDATTNIFSTNAGTISLRGSALTEGTNAVKASSIKDASNCVFGVNLAAAQSAGANVSIALDLMWEEDLWQDSTRKLGDIFEIVVATGTNLSGSTVAVPVDHVPLDTVATQRIFLGALTSVRSVGIRCHTVDASRTFRRELTIDNLRFGSDGGAAIAEECGAESIIASGDYSEPSASAAYEPGSGVTLIDYRDPPDISNFRRTRTAPWIINDGSEEVTADLAAFLSSGQPGERLILSGLYWTEYRIDMDYLNDFEVDARDAVFIRKAWSDVPNISMDTCDGIRWIGGKWIQYRDEIRNGSDSEDISGTATSGTTRVMDAANDRLQVSATGDANDGVGIYPFYRLEQYPTAIQALILGQDPDFIDGSAFAYTLSGTATVLVTFETQMKKETQYEYNKDFVLPVALDSSQTTFSGNDQTSEDLFGDSPFRIVPDESFRVGNEIITVTDWQSPAASGLSTWTLTRGAFGTTPAAHSVGDDVYKVVYTRTITTGASTQYVSPIRVDDRYKKYFLNMQQLGSGTATLHTYTIFGDNHYSSNLSEGASAFAIQNCKNCLFRDQKFEGIQKDAYQQQGRHSYNNHYENFEAHATARQGVSFNNGRQTYIGPGIINGTGRSGVDLEPASGTWRIHDSFIRDLQIWNVTNAGLTCGTNSTPRIANTFIDNVTVTRHGIPAFILGGRTVRARNLASRGGEGRDGLGLWADDYEVSDSFFDRSIQCESQTGLGDWHNVTAEADTDEVQFGLTPGVQGSYSLTVEGHQSASGAIANGDRVVFRNLSGGAGISAATEYYLVNANADEGHFKVATAQGGTAIDITSDMTAGQVRLSSMGDTRGSKRLRGRLVNVTFTREWPDVDPNSEVEFINCRQVSPETRIQKADLTPAEYGKDFHPLSVKAMSGCLPGMERDFFPRSFRGDNLLMHGIQALNALSLGGKPLMDFSSIANRPTTGTLFSQASRTGQQSATIDLGSAETHGKMLIRVIRTVGAGKMDPEIATSIDGVRYKTLGRLRRMPTATSDEPDSVHAVVDVRRFVKIYCDCIGGAVTFEAYYEFWPAGNNFSLVPVTFANGASTAAVTFPSYELPLAVVSSVAGDVVNTGTHGQQGALNPATTYYYRLGHRTWDRGPYQWAAEVSAAPGGANNANKISLGLGLRSSWVRTSAYGSSFTILKGTVAGTYTQRFDVLRPNPFSRLYYTSTIQIWDLGTEVYSPVGESMRDFVASNATTISLTASDESGWEPDTAYRVHVGDFTWNAGGYWITSKARTGFTINTANVTPDADNTCHVLIVR